MGCPLQVETRQHNAADDYRQLDSAFEIMQPTNAVLVIGKFGGVLERGFRCHSFGASLWLMQEVQLLHSKPIALTMKAERGSLAQHAELLQ